MLQVPYGARELASDCFCTFRLLMSVSVMLPVLPDSKAVGDMLLRERALVCFHTQIPSSSFISSALIPPQLTLAFS